MHEIANYNDIVPEDLRIKLNSQENKVKLEQITGNDGRIEQPYIFVVGLGEKHFKDFDIQIQKLTEDYPWLKKKHIRFVMNELIINTQFSMLRQVIKNVPDGLKVPAYFYVLIYVSDSFFSANIEEYGDFFDYYGYLENGFCDGKHVDEIIEDMYDDSNTEKMNDLNSLSGGKIKLILNLNNDLIVPDDSNKIGLNVIENATDHDFYITSFYKNGVYQWKRISFRIENS
ncbi:MAG: hypothetical protein JW982_15175 [Spirochaetes bacterium]|nr:hypothetical protein [Spirochaetota bacterium]